MKGVRDTPILTDGSPEIFRFFDFFFLKPTYQGSGGYAAFIKVLRQAKEWQAMRVLAYCLMPNHWHLVLWPHADGDLPSSCVG
jgi:hypothetical protein